MLQQLTSVVNYGGRVTDDKDMRTSDILIADFFQPKILSGKCGATSPMLVANAVMPCLNGFIRRL